MNPDPKQTVVINSADTVATLASEVNATRNNNQFQNQMKSHGASGIVNTGNTCYMNAALQAISHTYLFRHYLFENFEEIEQTLLRNAPTIYSSSKVLSPYLLQKIKAVGYESSQLTESEKEQLINGTMTFQVSQTSSRNVD